MSGILVFIGIKRLFLKEGKKQVIHWNAIFSIKLIQQWQYFQKHCLLGQSISSIR